MRHVAPMMRDDAVAYFFFFNDTATTEIYTLSLHDALPIFDVDRRELERALLEHLVEALHAGGGLLGHALHLREAPLRSEEHTSELQSLTNLVCRLLLEKKTIVLDQASTE